MKLMRGSHLSPDSLRVEIEHETHYWIVVNRGRKEILEVLEIAFRGKGAFTVTEDRRVAARRMPRSKERRQTSEILKAQDFIVAEQRSAL